MGTAEVLVQEGLETELHERLEQLRLLLDLDGVEGQGRTPDSLRRYFEESRLGYHLVHSRAGAMHMALNPEGEFDEAGYAAQADLISERLPPGTRDVLELASGVGFNLELMARMWPEVRFAGIDLVPEHVSQANDKFSALANVSAAVGDFHHLLLGDATFDAVFSIEGFGYAGDLSRALTELRRVLRPDGLFIVVDGWRTDTFSQKPADLRAGAEYMETSMAVAYPWELSAWKSAVIDADFEIVEELDLTDQVMPNLTRLAEITERRFISHPRRARILRKCLPASLVTNAIAGYLMPLTVQLGLYTYRMVVLTRPEA